MFCWTKLPAARDRWPYISTTAPWLHPTQLKMYESENSHCNDVRYEFHVLSLLPPRSEAILSFQIGSMEDLQSELATISSIETSSM